MRSLKFTQLNFVNTNKICESNILRNTNLNNSSNTNKVTGPKNKVFFLGFIFNF